MTQASAGVRVLAMAIAIGTTVPAWAHGKAERMRREAGQGRFKIQLLPHVDSSGL